MFYSYIWSLFLIKLINYDEILSFCSFERFYSKSEEKSEEFNFPLHTDVCSLNYSKDRIT